LASFINHHQPGANPRQTAHSPLLAHADKKKAHEDKDIFMGLIILSMAATLN